MGSRNIFVSRRKIYILAEMLNQKYRFKSIIQFWGKCVHES